MFLVEKKNNSQEKIGDVGELKQTGKRYHRDETQSEEERVERGSDKQEVKRNRTRLR